MDQKDQIVELIRSFNARVVSFYPLYADAFGGIGEAIFFQQIFYWSDKGSLSEGIIYKTNREMEEETHLSPRQQDRIRKNLMRLGVLRVWIAKANGVPTHHYQIAWGVLRNVLLDFNKKSYSSISDKTTKKAFPYKKGNAASLKRKRIYITALTKKITDRFSELCKKNIGVPPTLAVADHRQVTFAMHTGGLSEEQIYDLFDEWFRLGKSDEDTLSLTAALSRHQIDGYKIRNGVRG